MRDPWSILVERGFIDAVTDENAVRAELKKECVPFYAGFDPTAGSLHIGNLKTIMALLHLKRCGHRALLIVGGATTMIGDPSGKDESRPMMSKEDIQTNCKEVEDQLKSIFEKVTGGCFEIFNNAEWHIEMKMIDFLREIGSRFSVNQMLSTEVYKRRFQTTGVSFLELSYQLLQAYDFLELNKRCDCQIQFGGADQWANILAGTELIRRVSQKKAYGITISLLTDKQGQKMGKTVDGAVWLSADRLPPYDYYQFWINVDDEDVEKLLKIYTFLPLGEISSLCSVTGEGLRDAKRRLAYEATAFMHGDEEAKKAKNASEALFGKGSGIEDVPGFILSKKDIETMSAPELFVKTGLAASKGEFRRLLKQGGIYVNGKRLDSESALPKDMVEKDGTILLRVGKKKYCLVRTDES